MSLAGQIASLYRVWGFFSAAGASGKGRSFSISPTRYYTAADECGMPARFNVQSTARWPISR